MPNVSPDTLALWLYLPQFVQDQDAENGYTLLLWLDGIGSQMQKVDNIVRDSFAGPGWSTVMHPDACPPDQLPWLAQFVGVRFTSQQTTPTAQRAAIAALAGFARGTVASMYRAVLQGGPGGSSLLPPGTTMSIIERFPDPYSILVLIEGPPQANITYAQLEAEYDTYAEIQAAFALYADAMSSGAIPALTTYADLEAQFAIYAAAQAAFATYGDAETGAGFPALLAALEASKPAGLVLVVSFI